MKIVVPVMLVILCAGCGATTPPRTSPQPIRPVPPSSVTTRAPEPRGAIAIPTVMWDASTSPNIATYILNMRVTPVVTPPSTVPGAYEMTVDVGNVTSWRPPGVLAGRTYTFTILAKNIAGFISDPSVPVAWTAPGRPRHPRRRPRYPPAFSSASCGHNRNTCPLRETSSQRCPVMCARASTAYLFSRRPIEPYHAQLDASQSLAKWQDRPSITGTPAV